MSEALHFLLRHGYAVLFAAVCAEQAGFPVPALPFLLGMGALAGEGRFGFGMALGIAVLASLPGDWLWYELGRLRGYTVLRVICRIALEAETCVKRTENTFLRHGTGALVLAKFVPGFSTVAPPMAGMLRMPRLRFLALDSAGAALWAGAYLLTGLLFRRQLGQVAALAAGMGSWLAALLAGSLGFYLGWKWFERRRFVRLLASGRMAPEELLRRIESGDSPAILDLRHWVEYERDGGHVPGAIHLPPEELRQRQQEIPRDRDVVLYCT